MMKKILSVLLIIVAINFCKAQSASSGKHQKSVFVEGGGNGIGVSVNFDTRLKPDRNDGFGFRAGAGIVGTYITLPLGINYIAGKKRSGFESGFGITPVYNFNPGEYSSFFDVTKFTTLEIVTMGYRLQSINGFMFRINMSATYYKKQMLYLAGLSIGLNFK